MDTKKNQVMNLQSLFRNAVQAIGILCCLCAVFSCSRGAGCDKYMDERLIPLAFSASLASTAEIQTREAVNGNSFGPGTWQMSFWICVHEDDDPPTEFAPHMAHYQNLLATLDVSAATETQNVNIWYYGANNVRVLGVRENADVDIYAYYPYVANVTDITAVPFTSGQDDWMWAKPVELTAVQTAQNVTEPVKVPLLFSHIMTCIEVRMKTKYVGSVKLTSMTLSDTKQMNRLCSKGTYNATNGAVNPTDFGNSLTITPELSIGTTPTSIYLMFPKVEGYQDNDFELSFVFNGIDAQTTFSLPVRMTDSKGNEINIDGFNTGVKYIYELTLDNTMHFQPVGIDSDWSVAKQVEINLDL